MTVCNIFSFVPTYADVVWPARVLEPTAPERYTYHRGTDGRMAAVRFGGFGLWWKRCAVIEVVMNAVSTAAGVVLIPALGLLPGQVVNRVLGVGTFNPITWTAPLLMTALVTTAI